MKKLLLGQSLLYFFCTILSVQGQQAPKEEMPKWNHWVGIAPFQLSVAALPITVEFQQGTSRHAWLVTPKLWYGETSSMIADEDADWISSDVDEVRGWGIEIGKKWYFLDSSKDQDDPTRWLGHYRSLPYGAIFVGYDDLELNYTAGSWTPTQPNEDLLALREGNQTDGITRWDISFLMGLKSRPHRFIIIDLYAGVTLRFPDVSENPLRRSRDYSNPVFSPAFEGMLFKAGIRFGLDFSRI